MSSLEAPRQLDKPLAGSVGRIIHPLAGPRNIRTTRVARTGQVTLREAVAS